jgi:predicted outer membrane repeat protein
LFYRFLAVVQDFRLQDHQEKEKSDLTMKKSISCSFDVVFVQTGRLPPKESGTEATIDGKEIFVGKSNWKVKGKDIESIEVKDGNRTMLIVTDTKTFILENAVSDAHQWETFCSRVQALADKYKPEKQFSTFIQNSSKKGGAVATAKPRRKFGTQSGGHNNRNRPTKLIKTAALDDSWETFSDDDQDENTREITPSSVKKESTFDEALEDPIALDDNQDDEDLQAQAAEDIQMSETITSRGRRKRLQKKRGRKSALSGSEAESEDDNIFNDDTFTTPAAHRLVSPGTTAARPTVTSTVTRHSESPAASSPQKPMKDQSVISSFFHRRVDAVKKSETAPRTPERPTRTPERPSSTSATKSPGPALSAASARMFRSGKKALKQDTSWLMSSPAGRSPVRDHTTRLFGTDKPSWQLQRKPEDPIEDFESSPADVPIVQLQPRILKRPRMTYGTNPRRLAASMTSPQTNLADAMAASVAAPSAATASRFSATRDVQYLPNEPVKKTPIFRGLRNLGNTCYLNASLQMLNTLVGFTSLLKERGGRLTRSFVAVSQELADKTTKVAVNPQAVKAAMDEKTDMFVGYEQRDAHEFLSDLVDNIHEELQDKKADQGSAPDDSADTPMPSHKALPTDDFCLTVEVCLKCNACGYSR